MAPLAVFHWPPCVFPLFPLDRVPLSNFWFSIGPPCCFPLVPLAPPTSQQNPTRNLQKPTGSHLHCCGFPLVPLAVFHRNTTKEGHGRLQRTFSTFETPQDRPKATKSTPRGPKGDPRSRKKPQEHPKSDPRRPKSVPRAPQETQEHPKSDLSLRRPKGDPRAPQEAPVGKLPPEDA